MYNMPVKLVKMGSKFLSNELTNIFNDSFTSGVFPDKLRSAFVIPIHKADSKLCLNQYGPISNELTPPLQTEIEKSGKNTVKCYGGSKYTTS